MPGPTIPAPQFSTKMTRANIAYGAGFGAWNVYKLLTKQPPKVELQKTPWRPLGWAKTPRPVYLIDYYSNVYVFDAIFHLEHITSIRSTEHPVQTGTNIIDHSFQEPERLSFEIGMSDAMDNFFSSAMAGQPVNGNGINGTAVRWDDGANKSTSVYNTLKSLQYARLPISVQTRLNFYQNMIIERMVAPDDFKTQAGLKCHVTLRQLITAEVKTVKVSRRPHSSTSTPRGSVQPTVPTPTALAAMGF